MEKHSKSDGEALCKDSFESFSAIAQRELCAFSEEAWQQEPYIPVQVAMGCTELERKRVMIETKLGSLSLNQVIGLFYTVVWPKKIQKWPQLSLAQHKL